MKQRKIAVLGLLFCGKLMIRLGLGLLELG